mmetsp:Transcript_24520/g.58169  ORF Transcript_24520/g.58169 Transcript_24520/m.58169 type:complete len:1367 (-) Transcript_24520:57-4157(-)
MMKRLSLRRRKSRRSERGRDDDHSVARNREGQQHEESAATSAAAATSVIAVAVSAAAGAVGGGGPSNTDRRSRSRSRSRRSRSSPQQEDKNKKRSNSQSNKKAKDAGRAVGTFIRSRIKRSKSTSAASSSNLNVNTAAEAAEAGASGDLANTITGNKSLQPVRQESLPIKLINTTTGRETPTTAGTPRSSTVTKRPSAMSTRTRRQRAPTTAAAGGGGGSGGVRESPTKTFSTSTASDVSLSSPHSLPAQEELQQELQVVEDNLSVTDIEGVAEEKVVYGINDDDGDDDCESNKCLSSLGSSSRHSYILGGRNNSFATSSYETDDEEDGRSDGPRNLSRCSSADDNDDDHQIETTLLFSTSQSSIHSHKSYSKHREDLMLESRRAIQRKQSQANRHQQLDEMPQQQQQQQQNRQASKRHARNDKPTTAYDWSFLDDRVVSPPPSSEKSTRQRASITPRTGTTPGPDLNFSFETQRRECKRRSRSLSRRPDRKLGRRNDNDLFDSDDESRSVALEQNLKKRSTSVDARTMTRNGRIVNRPRQRSESPSSRIIYAEFPHHPVAGTYRPGGPVGSSKFGNPSSWHIAILQHDWDAVDALLETFDHTKYRPQPKTNPDASKKNKKAKQKKLRVLRYLPKRRSSSGELSDDDLDDCQDAGTDEPTISPLLQVDKDGRTPLHVACTQQMPEKLLLKLYFVGRDATTFKDCDGRYPIHLAMIHDLSEQVMERFIHSNAASLGTPDRLNHSPLQYAIRKARRLQSREDFRTSDQMWSTPATPSQFEWQVRQTKAWEKVKFLLDEMMRRRKLLSPRSEKNVILQTIESRGPPRVVEAMLSAGEKLFDQEQLMLMKAFSTTLKHRYPINIVRNMMEMAEKHLPPHLIARILRDAVDEHLQLGLHGVDASTSFCRQLLSAARVSGVHEKVRVTSSCKEWWTTLRLLIGYSARYQCNRPYDENVLSAALAIPNPPPSLIVFLCRLMPPLKYTATGKEGMSPLHLYCSQNNEAQDSVMILKILIGSDPTIAKAQSKVGRLSLHYAILSDKSLAFVWTLLHAYRKAAFVDDPVSGLFPFQLAALNGTLNALNVSFLLLHTKPHAIAPQTRYGSGDPTADITKLRQHVLNWCYKNNASRSNPILNRQRIDMLRNAIESGRISTNSLKRFWLSLKSLIWTAYYETPFAVAMPLSDENLLLAALAVSDQIPPIVIELILELRPQSAFTEHPGNAILPIHAAAKAPPYESLPFEVTLSMDLTEMVVLSNPAALTLTSQSGSLPLHIAIESGKTWTVLHSLVERYPKALFVRDPRTRLFPFQLAACQESFIRVEKLVQRKTALTKWSKQSSKENGRLLRQMVDDYQLSKLTTIYEFLRSRPGVLQ